MKISIAIPDSTLNDEKTNLGKSQKISLIARACAIFEIDTIFIYKEGKKKINNTFLITILKYLETPQFLRRQLFQKIADLKYAGTLHPLKIPSHIVGGNPKQIKNGDIREGVVVIFKGKKFVDVGIHQLIPYFGKENIGKRISIQFKNGYPEFSIKEITRDQITKYWGYQVKERSDLFSLVSSWNGEIILTSRKGKTLSETQLQKQMDSKKDFLVVFGSTDKGVHDILGHRINQIHNSKVFNFFPNQGTETVRIEEALLGTLAILNILTKMK